MGQIFDKEDAMSEEKQEKSQEGNFKVNDKRGQEKQTAPADKPEVKSDSANQEAKDASSAQDQATQLPEASFINFILSLGTSAMMHMGLVPEGHQAEVNLPMAKHEIELLDMLAEKTKNNLDDKEAELLKQLLYELRMRYVESTKS
jgi:hypothetical protein